ncbi:membrane protein [Nitrospira sp.]|nr:membrane protein [Nitrospira sp.]
MSDIQHFLIEYGVAVLMAVVFAEQVGLPLPAFPLLVAAGALAGAGYLNPWVAVALTLCSSLLADGLWYELGRRKGRPVLDWLCRISLEPTSCVRRTEAFFVTHGARSLVLAKFLPGLSTIAPPLAGIVGFGLLRFLLYDGVGAFLWTGSGLGIGYAFTEQIEEMYASVEAAAPIVTSGLLALAVSYIAYKALVRRSQLNGVSRISADELWTRFADGEPLTLIDVRQLSSDTETPAIPQAIRLSIDDLTHRYAELPHDRDLVIYCGCPADAAGAHAALVLQRKGLARVRVLAGGIEAWRSVAEKHTSGSEIAESSFATV